MRKSFNIGDLVEPWGILVDHEPKYVGVIMGRYKLSSDCYSYKVKWHFKDKTENWSPLELGLVCASANKNK
jgi:hypothetical protein